MGLSDGGKLAFSCIPSAVMPACTVQVVHTRTRLEVVKYAIATIQIEGPNFCARFEESRQIIMAMMSVIMTKFDVGR